MTAGGPFNSTDVLGTYAYSKAFTQYEFSQVLQSHGIICLPVPGWDLLPETVE